jgi:hypothetical protein
MVIPSASIYPVFYFFNLYRIEATINRAYPSMSIGTDEPQEPPFVQRIGAWMNCDAEELLAVGIRRILWVVSPGEELN